MKFHILIVLLSIILSCHLSVGSMKFTDTSRPNPSSRTFQSQAVEDFIESIKSKITSPDLAVIFENCFPNTLDTTILYLQNETFVITGDIPAMWLRDSTNQLMPYFPLMNKDKNLEKLIKDVLKTQVKSVIMDPYANAFTANRSQHSIWRSDHTRMRVGVWERKYEIDSLAALLKLTNKIIEYTGDTSILDANWMKAFDNIMKTIKIEQQSMDESMEGSPYTFQRSGTEPTETLMKSRGNPYRSTGLVRSAFRPSDDACLFQFNIPGNAMLQVELEKIGKTLVEKKINETAGQDAVKFAEDLKIAIYKYGITRDNRGNPILAYEVDGFGNYYKMDDANIPSLLSLPYLGFMAKDDKLYLNTRKFVLSEDNPYFFQGEENEGIGGPHVGMDYIWPMSIIVRGLTSIEDEEIQECLAMLVRTTAGRNFMHEAFRPNSPESFTRHWFSWANSLFGEFIVHLAEYKPHLLQIHYKNEKK